MQRGLIRQLLPKSDWLHCSACRSLLLQHLPCRLETPVQRMTLVCLAGPGQVTQQGAAPALDSPAAVAPWCSTTQALCHRLDAVRQLCQGAWARVPDQAGSCTAVCAASQSLCTGAGISSIDGELAAGRRLPARLPRRGRAAQRGQGRRQVRLGSAPCLAAAAACSVLHCVRTMDTAGRTPGAHACSPLRQGRRHLPQQAITPRGGCRAFTTLSEALGHTVASLHRGLAQGVQAESAPLVLAAQLRALQSLAAACPYHRLPPSLLGTVSAVRPYMHELLLT